MKWESKSVGRVASGVSSPLDTALNAEPEDLLVRIRNHIRKREVRLAYQPIVRADMPEQIVFYEALIRIVDENGRVLPARDFINLLEDDEAGRQLDCLALEMGISALAADPTLRLSLNMSARSIGYRRWTQVLDECLRDDPHLAERLILEITEKSAMLMPELVTSFMSDLQQRGIAFALDDFGAGHTAFRYLRQFYFDALKIDGQFVEGVAHNPDNQVLTAALVSLAKHFDMLVIAECVQNHEDAEYLVKAGVDCLQGYLFGAPTFLEFGEQSLAKRA